MTERQWELYRLSVVKRMPDSEYKTAVLAGIAHKLRMLDRIEAFSQHLPAQPQLQRPFAVLTF
jgi:hypothetical protein